MEDKPLQQFNNTMDVLVNYIDSDISQIIAQKVKEEEEYFDYCQSQQHKDSLDSRREDDTDIVEEGEKERKGPNEAIQCDCGRTYTKPHKSRHFKKWHTTDPTVSCTVNVTVNIYNPNESVQCNCGRTYTKSNKSRHFKKWHIF